MTSGASGSPGFIACPFCGLGCDDLTVAATAEGVAVDCQGCGLADGLFNRPHPPAPPPRIDGRPASAEEAAGAAARLLAGAARPLFAGLGTDVAGLRAAVALARRVGGSLDHLASAGLFRNMTVMRRSGWIATTLAEVRNRCDLLLVVGEDPAPRFPRLYERVLPPGGLFLDPGMRRTVIFLGPEPEAGTRAALAGSTVVTVPCAAADLPDALAVLTALVAGRAVPVLPPGLDGAALEDLSRRLAAARYGVVAWAAEGFAWPHADLTVEQICALIVSLHARTRFSALPLSGRDNGAGANQVCAWQTGYPLRTRFIDGVPEHDPYGEETARAAAEADLLVWVQAFRPQPPPDFDGPAIVLAPPDTVLPREPAVFIPVATPGIDTGGIVFRTDTIVSLPLAGLIDRGLPAVATVLSGVSGALPGEKGQ